MDILKNQRASLKVYGKKLGREGLAKLAQDSIREYLSEEGTYKRAMHLVGIMTAIGVACEYDDYWDSKVVGGFITGTEIIEYTAEKEKEKVNRVCAFR